MTTDVTTDVTTGSLHPDLPDLPTASRRSFFKLLGVGAAASLAACKRLPVENALPYLVPPEEITPGVPAHYASTCTACTASCGLLATILDGRPVKLEGNPEHPLSKGGLCAVGQADLRALYDAGRLREPMLAGKPTTWQELDRRAIEGLGRLRGATGKLYLVTTTLVSPTARATVEGFLARHGGTLVEYDAGPRSWAATREAYELLDGEAVLPALNLAAADVLVCFGADLLGTGPEPVAHTSAYAARRRDAKARGTLRHVQIEGSLTLTGAAADERWAVGAREERLLSLWLLRLVAEGLGAPSPAAALQALPAPSSGLDRVTRLARELTSRRGHGLVVTGSPDPLEALAVVLTNRLLGSEGSTLDMLRPSLVRRGLDHALAAFLEALDTGNVGGVLVLNADPVDELPNGDKLAEAIRKLPLSIAITDRGTATARACALVASAHHGLEAWGDFEPRPDLVTLAQPAIRPLFNTRHAIESLLHWSGASVTDYRRHLMSTWEKRAGLGSGAEFEAFWTESVRNGRIAMPERSSETVRKDADPTGSSVPQAVLGRLAATLPPPSPGLEVELIEEVALRDGRKSHIPWLRELPDPLTRSSWVATVRIAPETARSMGVHDGDLLRLDVQGRTITLPARVLPGQASGVLGVPVGYGRHDRDRDDNHSHDGGDALVNGYRLARFQDGRLLTHALATRAERAPGHKALPLIQTHSFAEGRPVVFQVALPTSPVPKGEGGPEHAAGEPGTALAEHSLWPERPPTTPKWEMVIDLDSCTGCSACVVACQAENNLPVVGEDEILRHRDMYWLRLDRYFAGDPGNPDVLFSPMLCAQCGNAPCETVCPVAATVHSEDGLNQQVYNRCVGTRYCANNCPYKVRRFNWFDHEFREPVERMVLNPNVVVRERGVMEKCTFCVQRIQAGRLAARREGEESFRGLGVQTACQQSCPARAITFGDATDPKGEIAHAKKEPRAFQVLAELGVQPSVTYLARVRNRPTRSETDPAEATS